MSNIKFLSTSSRALLQYVSGKKNSSKSVASPERFSYNPLYIYVHPAGYASNPTSVTYANTYTLYTFTVPS